MRRQRKESKNGDVLNATNRAIFFDRDGTLIVDKVYLNDPDQIEYLPGVFEALVQLQKAGFVFFIATNQSGIPRGLVTIENLTEIHRRMAEAFAQHGVKFKEFFFAPFPTESDHPLRKPNPGMLLAGAEKYGIDLKKSWMIGDRMLDVEAGHRAGARSILVGQREKVSDFKEWRPPAGVFENVIDAVPFILESAEL